MNIFFIIYKSWVGSNWISRPTRYLLGTFQILSIVELSLSGLGTLIVVGLFWPDKLLELKIL
jgi:hypothetical protein